MHELLFKIIRYSGLPFLFREVMQRRRVTIVMMHNISLSAAKQAFRYWKRHYNIISMQDYLNARNKESSNILPKKPLILTFDDGHKGNYKLISLIEELKMPVTIFLCSDIVGTSRHFWFLHDGCDADKFKKIPDETRIEKLAENGFSQTKEYPTRQALSGDEIMKMKESPLIDLQSHTRFHPVLTKCTQQKAFDEVCISKEILEKKYNLNITGFAYPNGDYEEREIGIVKKAGYDYALSATSGYNSLKTDLYKLKRLSVNDSENLDEIVVKSSGVWGAVKYCRDILFVHSRQLSSKE